jgi:ADP-heptose:LPS heptosyltransferase
VSINRFSWKTPVNPENKPTCCIIRYGAYGDTVQAASLCAAARKAGYHVTFICSFPGSELVFLDPNIDRLIVQMQNQVPIGWLGHFWIWYRSKGAPGHKPFDKWVNLTESVECNLLAIAGNIKFEWTPKARHQAMNFNYLEHQHLLADLPYAPEFKFHSTDAEKRWRDEELARMKKAGIQKYILWALAGSSRTHKLYPHEDQIWAHVLQHYSSQGWGVMSVGDPTCTDLEKGFEGQPRFWRTSGKYTMRQVALMMETADVVVGPETGVMSMAAFYPMPKIVFLSHSTVENLTRDWINTTSLWAPNTHCPGRGANEVPACHKMLASFEGCRRHEKYGTAQCAAEILPEWVWEAIQVAMNTGAAPKWQPPSA